MKIPTPLQGSRKAGFARLCLVAGGQAGLAAASAFIVKRAFNSVSVVADQPDALWDAARIAPLGALVGVAAALAWLRRRERIEAEILGQTYAHDVRMMLYDRLGSLMPRDLQEQSRGGHLLRFTGDLTALRQWVSLGLARLIVATITATAALVALATINPVLAVTVAAVLGIGSGVTVLQGKSLYESVKVSRRRNAQLAGDINERITVMPVVQMFSQVNRERRRVARRSAELRDAMISRARVVGTMRGFAELTNGVSLAAILAAGAFEVGAGRASLGAIVAAMSVLSMLKPALRDLNRVNEYWQAFRVAIERVRALGDMRPSVEPRLAAPDLPRVSGVLEFQDVSFGTILSNISASARPGTVVAIAGPNGAGKSTLLSLVAGFIEPTSGVVRIDGHDLRDHSAASIRAAIGVVSPDLPLMRGTIGRNIRYRAPDTPVDEVARICALCGVDDLLEKIPGGIEARVSEGGLNLSPGQRQRIALARAMLGRPSILLFDEVDANMDPDSARLIDAVLQSYEGIVLFVSHRPERIAQADEVWHLSSGTIVERGAPADLMRRDGPTQRFLARPLELVA